MTFIDFCKWLLIGAMFGGLAAGNIGVLIGALIAIVFAFYFCD